MYYLEHFIEATEVTKKCRFLFSRFEESHTKEFSGFNSKNSVNLI
jgi:hypothetical protein